MKMFTQISIVLGFLWVMGGNAFGLQVGMDMQLVGDGKLSQVRELEVTGGQEVVIELFATGFDGAIGILATLDVDKPEAIASITGEKKQGFNFPKNPVRVEGSQITFSQGGLSAASESGSDLKLVGVIRIRLNDVFTGLEVTLSNVRVDFLTVPTKTVMPDLRLSLLPGPGPEMRLSTPELLFSDVRVERSDTLSFQIYNVGEGVLSGTVASSDLSVFPLVSETFSVSGGDSISVSVIFVPEREGRHEGGLTILSNDPAAQNMILALSGKGVTITGGVAIDLNPAPGNQGLVTKNVTYGETVTVELYVSDFPEVRGIGLEGRFSDPFAQAILSAKDSVGAGDFLPEATLLFKTTGSVFELGVASLNGMTAAGGGRLATLTFAVTSDRPGTTGIISVSRLGYTLLDGTLEEKPVDVSATIKIVIRGDFDGDNQVGFRDFLLFAAAFGSKDAAFDLDFDGTVGFSDFVAFARAYGE